MTKLLQITLLFISIGLIFMPSETIACGAKKAMKSKGGGMEYACKKQNLKVSDHKKDNNNSCCEKSIDSIPKSTKSNHDCNGHCNHNSCKCAALSFSVNLPQSIDIKLNSYISISKNTIISHDENHLPSGFYSIWLPPVIG